MDYYFFDQRVFDYIQQTPPAPLRGEVEITDVAQKMADGGAPIAAIVYQGHYINITFPDDLRQAEAIFHWRCPDYGTSK